MRTFASLLPADVIVPSPRALACVLLDRAGVDPDAIRTGVTVIACTNSVTEDVTRAVDHLALNGESEDIMAWTSPGPEGKYFLLSGRVDDDAFKRALALAKPVIVVAHQSHMPKDADIHATRQYTVHSGLTDHTIAAVIRLVTGDEVDCAGLAARLAIPTILAAVRPGESGRACADRLRAIVWRMADEAAKKQAERDAAESAKATDVAEDVGAAAADPVVTKLSDLTGFGDAKAWGLQLASDLRAYAGGNGTLSWEDVDRGILLVGEPGVGKTFFMRALAAECGLPLINASYGDMEAAASGWQISKAIKKVFADARKRAPCLVFMDEIDSYGVRGANAHNDSFWGALINALLAELDGAEPRPGVVVCAATNHLSRVDPALLRPGRLERVVEIPAPRTLDEIAGVIGHHAPGLGDVEAARSCRGLSPAAIAMVCRDARRAARRDGREPTSSDVVAAARWLAAPRSEADDIAVSRHEATHAVAAVVLGLDLQSVTMSDPPHASTKFRTLLATRDYVERHIVMSLAARRADAMMGDGVTAGAAADLETATTFAKRVVTQWGMWSDLYAHNDADLIGLPRDTRGDVEALLEAMDLRAAKLVDAHRAEIARVAEALRERRYLDGAEVAEIVRTPTPEQAA